MSPKDPFYFGSEAWGSYNLWSLCGVWFRRKDTWGVCQVFLCRHESWPWEPMQEHKKHPILISSDLFRAGEASLVLGSHWCQKHLSPHLTPSCSNAHGFTLRLPVQFCENRWVWLLMEVGQSLLTGGQHFSQRKWRSSWLMHGARELGIPAH